MSRPTTNGVHPEGLTHLANLLRLYRTVYRVDTRTFAQATGLSAATINRMERGHAMDAATLMKVLNWLMGRGGSSV